MLDNLRNASQSWAMRLVLGLIVIAFIVFWTAGDALNWRSMGESQTVAKVGGKKIPLRDFTNDVRRRAAQVKAQSGTDPDTRILMQIILNEHITHKLIELEAERMGLIVSDDAVRDSIRSEKSFQDKDDHFNKESYHQFLRMAGYEENEFVEMVRRDIQRQQLIQTLISGLTVPETTLKQLMMWNFEKREIKLAHLKYADTQNVKNITKEDIQNYYETHRDEFTIPESRDFSVIILDLERVKNSLNFTDVELQTSLKDRFSARKPDHASKAESDEILSQLKNELAEEKLLDLSNKIQDEIAGGARLEDLGKAYKIEVIKVQGFQKTTQNVPGLEAEHILALTQDGFSAVEDDIALTNELEQGGYIFIQLDNIHPPKTQELPEVEKKIEQSIKTEEKEELTLQKAQAIVEQAKAGKSLSNQLKTETRILDRETTSKDLPMHLRRSLFNAKLGEIVISKTEDGCFIAEFTKVIPAEQKTLDENREKFKIAAHTLITEDILFILLKHLEGKYKIERNIPLLESMASR